jgi:membrane dipeptidase
LIIIDAHEDLAWNALTFGRDYRRAMVETRRLEAKDDTPKYNGQALIGWPEWIKGRVGIVFSSLFSAPLRWKEGPWDTLCYDNPVEAHHHYQASLDVYSQWIEESPDKIQLIKDTHTLQDHWAAWQDPNCAGPVGFIMLMEGADGIREPAEVAQWFERGVRILGLSWSGTRYAGGTKEPGPLTDLGRELLRHMDACGMILDLSHLSEDGAREALDLFQGPVIASHTSFLARVPNAEFPERLLSEEMIRLITEREGVMGLLLGNRFLQNNWVLGMDRDLVGMQDIVAAIDYVCQLLGNANHIALGSDFDGGFGLDQVPMGLDSIADLRLIGDALQEYGYTPEDVEAIMGLNWYHLLQRSLPED